MNESRKSTPVTVVLEGMFGRSSAIAAGRCVDRPFGCGQEISLVDAEGWSEVVKREYSISGLCGTCQAQVFGAGRIDQARIMECNGLCMRASDVGVGVSGDPVAYPHPECPEHGKGTES